MNNACCANQMFVLGPHRAMQCHVEMTPPMIAQWCLSWGEVDPRDALPATVRTPHQMLAETAARMPLIRRLADQLYSVWTGGLKA